MSGRFVDPAGHSGPRLRTGDLSWMEISDALWLARSIGAQPDDGQQREPPDSAHVAKVDPGDEPLPTPPGGSPEPAHESDVGSSWSTRLTPTADGVSLGTFAPRSPVRELPQAARLARALRPLMKRAPSPWKHDLNEEATAVRAAQDKMWLPVWQPAPWRRFELVMVVDTAPSMDVWQPTVAEFRELMRQQGAFRNVRTLLMDCSGVTERELTLRVEGPAGALQSTRHLLDPTGRRLVMVVTDAIGNAWRDGSVERVLSRWADRMPLAIVNVLPSRLWSWGGLAPRRVCLSAGAPGVANRQLRVRPIEHDLFDEDHGDRVPVPVLALTPEWLSGWANLFMASGLASVDTTAVFLNPSRVVGDEPVADRDGGGSPLERVMRFRTYASVQAFQLASLLAAAPLNLAMMRFVQRELLPDSDISALAEVLLGGILRTVPTSRSVHDPTAVVFEFYDGVREELLSSTRRADTVRVARVLGDYLGSSVAMLRNFRDAVDDPDTTVRPEVSYETVPYLRVQEAVFRALSGRYAPRAVSLRRDLQTVGYGLRTGSVRKHFRHSLSADDTEMSPVVAGVGGGEAESGPDERTSDTRPQVLGSIPLRNPDFVGREDLLQRLARRLAEPGVTVVVPEALQGMGGVGKSQTVIEYIYRHSGEYDVIWWIPAEQMSQINASFIELAKRLGLPASSAETAVAEVLEGIRTGKPFQRWLLVFDNVDGPESVTPFMPTSSAHVVVTSRNPRWAEVARTIEVDLFTREESIELLRRHGGEITEAEADRLADALGDLPLTVEQAAVWRAHTGMPVAEYLQLVERHLATFPRDERTIEYGDVGYQAAVAAVWNVPLDRLRVADPAALQLLQVCAFFGPESIPRSLFTGGRSAPVPEELAAALTDPIKLNRAIRRIGQYGLAKIDHRNNTLQLHRLVQAVVKNQLTDEQKDRNVHTVHLVLVHGDPDDPESSLTWQRYAELLPHAVLSNAIECRTSAWVRRLVINLVRYLLNSGDYLVALDLARQTLAVWQTTFGQTNADTLEIAHLGGQALWRLGRYEEAHTLNRETYGLVLDTFGQDNELFLSVANTLRMSMRAQGRFVEELQMQRNIYDRSRHVLGENDPATLRYANDLAGSLRLNGEFFAARALDEDTWERKRIVLGEEHPDTFLTMNALAMDMRECGQHIEACQTQENNLARQRAVIGDDHPRTIGAMRNLSVARRRAGLHVQAAELSVECVRLYRRRHGARHQDTITAQMCLAADLRHLGNLPESRELGAASYRVFVETHGARHPFSLVAAINLAVTLRLLGEVDEARELDTRTLTDLRGIFTDDHPFILVTATNLASDLAAQGEFETARGMDVSTFERSTRTLGARHPSTLAVALNLSIDLAQLGRLEESTKLHPETVTGFREVLGPDHPATQSAIKSIRADCDTDTMQL